MESLEELILFILAVPFCLNSVIWMILCLLRQYTEWKSECKRMLTMSSVDYCMCGSKIESHTINDGHAPLSERDWAVNNLPKLELG